MVRIIDPIFVWAEDSISSLFHKFLPSVPCV